MNGDEDSDEVDGRGRESGVGPEGGACCELDIDEVEFDNLEEEEGEQEEAEAALNERSIKRLILSKEKRPGGAPGAD